MKNIKRVTKTIGAKLEWFISQIENQEAVAKSALNEAEHYHASAKVRLNRLKSEGKKLEAEISKLQKEESLWIERAKRHGETNREKALECLKRSQKVKANCEERQRIAAKQQEQVLILEQQISEVGSKLADMRSKLSTLRAREACQSTSQALHENVNGKNFGELDRIFEQWEDRVLLSEFETMGSVSEDYELEQSLQSEEETAELESLLDSILAAEKSS